VWSQFFRSQDFPYHSFLRGFPPPFSWFLDIVFYLFLPVDSFFLTPALWFSQGSLPPVLPPFFFCAKLLALFFHASIFFDHWGFFGATLSPSRPRVGIPPGGLVFKIFYDPPFPFVSFFPASDFFFLVSRLCVPSEKSKFVVSAEFFKFSRSPFFFSFDFFSIYYLDALFSTRFTVDVFLLNAGSVFFDFLPPPFDSRQQATSTPFFVPLLLFLLMDTPWFRIYQSLVEPPLLFFRLFWQCPFSLFFFSFFCVFYERGFFFATFAFCPLFFFCRFFFFFKVTGVFTHFVLYRRSRDLQAFAFFSSLFGFAPPPPDALPEKVLFFVFYFLPLENPLLPFSPPPPGSHLISFARGLMKAFQPPPFFLVTSPPFFFVPSFRMSENDRFFTCVLKPCAFPDNPLPPPFCVWSASFPLWSFFSFLSPSRRTFCPPFCFSRFYLCTWCRAFFSLFLPP